MSGHVAADRSARSSDPGVGTPASDAGDPGGRQPSSLLAATGAGWLSTQPKLLAATRLAELAAALGVSLATLQLGRPGATSALWGIVVASLSWLVWIAAGNRRRIGMASLVVMAAAGGVMAVTRGAGSVFVGISASSAAWAFELPLAAAVTCTSFVAWVIAAWSDHSPAEHVFQLTAIALLGFVSGSGRRQLVRYGRQEALLATAEQRAAVAQGEAELLAERNRLGRDMHDVLAHTLGVISIQLTALDSRVAAGDAQPEVRDRIAAIHRLVGDGLGEARDAVRALRDDGTLLDDQLGRLCGLHGAALTVQGTQTALGAGASLALYRTVQEALTNVERHAPGALVTVTLTFQTDATHVLIDNARSPSQPSGPLAHAGGGNGLRGMRERLQLTGGTLDAGPTREGWRVHATVPVG